MTSATFPSPGLRRRKEFSHPPRVAVRPGKKNNLLEHGELCVCEKVSFHLATLKDAGLVNDTNHGKWIHYRLDESDIFRRFLVISILERANGEGVLKDKERLEKFCRGKDMGSVCGKC